MKPMIKLLTIALIIFFSNQLFGQEIIKNRDFPKEALYGYMNGGSDLYLEYGFESLNVQEVKYGGYEYSVEVFNMSDEFAAFGIYSIHIHKPIVVDTLLKSHQIEGFDCLSKYQLQAVCGKNYYSIIFNDGQKAAKGAQELLLKKITEGDNNIETDKKKIPTLLEKAGIFNNPYSGRIKFVKGEIALSNVDDSLVERFAARSWEGLWIYKQSGEEAIVLNTSFELFH